MRSVYLIILGATVLVDQVVKHIMVGFMTERDCQSVGGLPHFCEPVHVTPFLDLVMVWNRGVSFGLFANNAEYGAILLGAINLVVAVGLIVWILRADNRLLRLSLAFVAGGAIGNAIDRFVWGAVADFFDVYATGSTGDWLINAVGTAHWPAFNVADMAISAGVIGLIADSLFGGRESTRKTS